MKLRCPYCKQEFGPEPRATCPHCGKTMRIPGSLLGKKDEAGGSHRERLSGDDGGGMIGQVLASGTGTRLVVAIGVLVIVGGLFLSRLSLQPVSRIRPTPESRATAEVRIIRIAVERFRRDCGRYPDNKPGLVELIDQGPGIAGWKGPYVNLLKPDPWSRYYVYRFTNDAVTLLSMGGDGVEGTADDVCAPEGESLRAAEAEEEKAAQQAVPPVREAPGGAGGVPPEGIEVRIGK